jgi:hypothetical protein
MNLRDVILELLEDGVVMTLKMSDTNNHPEHIQVKGKAQIIMCIDSETQCSIQLVFYTTESPDITDNIKRTHQTLKNLVEVYKKEQNV